MEISPALSGFLKGLMLVVFGAIAAYFSDATHLTGVFPPLVVSLVVAVASAVESSIKASTGAALFGAVKVRKV